MISTVDDMLTWSEKFLRVGARGDDDLSLSRVAVTPNGLGLGVVVFNADVGGCVFNGGCREGAALLGVMGTGSVPGTNSVVAYFPKWDLTIVGASTSSLTDVDHGLVNTILGAVVPDAKGS